MTLVLTLILVVAATALRLGVNNSNSDLTKFKNADTTYQCDASQPGGCSANVCSSCCKDFIKTAAACEDCVRETCGIRHAVMWSWVSVCYD